MFGTFKIKKYVEFNLTSFDTLKHYCVTKAIKMFNFLPLINSSVTIGLSFMSLITSAIDHQKLLIFYVSFLDCILQYLYKDLVCYLFEYLIKP